MRKQILRSTGVAVTALLAVAGLSACSDGGSSNTLTIWTRTDGESYMRDLAKKYESENEGLKVEVTAIPNSDVATKFAQALSAGDVPDVMAMDVAMAPYFVSKNGFEDITDRIDELSYADTLLKGQLDAGTSDGSNFVVPFTADASALFYNKDLFEEAGLDPEHGPQTWDEFVDAANAIGALGSDYEGYHFSAGCGGCAAFVLAPMLWAAGGDFLDSSSGSLNPAPTFDDPLAIEFIEKLQSAVEGGGITTASQVDGGENYGGAFENGKLGMVSTGSFQLANFMANPLPFELGVVPLPGKKAGENAAFTGGDVLAIPNGTPNSDAAWKFLEWATGDDAQTFLSDGGFTPVRTDLLETVYSEKGPEFAAMAEATTNGRVPVTVSFTSVYSDANGPFVSLMQAGVFGKDVPAAAAAAQDAAEQIFESNE
ncbi:sugar ABC transporter substrate-binding protein [Microbacterium sp. NPDC089318]